MMTCPSPSPLEPPISLRSEAEAVGRQTASRVQQRVGRLPFCPEDQRRRKVGRLPVHFAVQKGKLSVLLHVETR